MKVYANLLKCSYIVLFVMLAMLSGEKVAVASNDVGTLIIFTEEVNQTLALVEQKYPQLVVETIEEAGIVVLNNVPVADVKKLEQELEQYLNLNELNVIQDVKLSAPTVEVIKSRSYYNISKLDELWNIKAVTRNFESFKINTGSHQTKIGIIDTGVDLEHPDLKHNIVSEGKSLVPGVLTTDDQMGHGTMVAGIIAANGQIQGVAPNIGIVPYKVYDDVGSYATWVIKAIIEATNDGMDVINLSLNTFKSKKNPEDREIIKAFEKAFQYAKKHETIIVASAGNEGVNIGDEKALAQYFEAETKTLISLPGGSDKVITVGASTKNNEYALYSNFGKPIDLVAPGGSVQFNEDFTELDYSSLILTTYPTDLQNNIFSMFGGIGNGYQLDVGTSLSAAHVTATVGLIKDEYMKKYKKQLPNHKVEKILLKNTTSMNYSKKLYGEGQLDTYQALINVKK